MGSSGIDRIVAAGVVAILGASISLKSADAAGTDPLITAYKLFRSHPVMMDDVEHASCPGPVWGARSCPSANPISRIEPSTDVAHSGSYSYKLPAPNIPDPAPNPNGAISSGKLETGYGALYRNETEGKTTRFSAYYYIASGFDTFEVPSLNIKPFHLQMQWKMVAPERDPGKWLTVNGDLFSDRYWGPQNPKIQLGFHNLTEGTGRVRQLQLIVREPNRSLCQMYDWRVYTRRSTLNQAPIVIPSQTWVRITVEIRFHPTDGYVKVWQGEQLTNANLAIDTTRTAGVASGNINTMSQVVTAAYAKDSDVPCLAANGTTYYWSGTQAFDFGVDNYTDVQAYDSRARPPGATADHLLYVDDIEVRPVLP